MNRSIQRSKASAVALGLMASLISLPPEASAAVPSHYIEMVSVSSSEQPQLTNYETYINAVSADGNFVAFQTKFPFSTTDTNTTTDVYLRDRVDGNTIHVSLGLGRSTGVDPSISWDGNYITFESAAGLVPEDTNGVTDVYLFERATSSLTRVSRAPGGAQGSSPSVDSSISGDGRFITFASRSPELVAGDSGSSSDVFVLDRVTNTLVRVSDGTHAERPSMSDDGRYVYYNASLFQNEGPYAVPRQGKLADLSTGTVRGDLPNGTRISGDGRFLLWAYDTDEFRDLYRMDLATGDSIFIDWVHAPYLVSFDGSMSYDGRFLAYTTYAGTIRLRDLSTGENIRPDVSASGQRANFSTFPVVSRDGDWVVFSSEARNIVASDLNPGADVFLAHEGEPAPPIVSSPASGTTDTIDSLFQGSAEPGTEVQVFEGSTRLASFPVQSDGTWSGYLPLPDGPHNLSVLTSTVSSNRSLPVTVAIDVRPTTVNVPFPIEKTTRLSTQCAEPTPYSSATGHSTVDAATGTFSQSNVARIFELEPGGTVLNNPCVAVMAARSYSEWRAKPTLQVPSTGTWQVEMNLQVNDSSTSSYIWAPGVVRAYMNTSSNGSVTAQFTAFYELCPTASCQIQSSGTFNKVLGYNGTRTVGPVDLVGRLNVTNIANARIRFDAFVSSVAEQRGGGRAAATIDGRIVSLRIRKAR